MQKYHYEWIQQDEAFDTIQRMDTDVDAIEYAQKLAQASHADIALHRVEGDERCHMQDVIYIEA